MTFKIAALLNKSEREGPTMDAIRARLAECAPDCELKTFVATDPEFTHQVMRYRPQVLLSYPYTARTCSVRSYLFKHILGCFNVCLRTEGQLDYRHGNKNTWLVGLEPYGPDFVDYELFWSRRIAQMTGEELVRCGKLSSPERIRVFGYPPYEVYFRPWDDAEDTMPAAYRERMDATPRERVVTFITNFCFADYSAEDIVRAGDLVDASAPDAQQEVVAGINGARRCAVFRQKWIDNILRTAYRNPDALVVVKSHPVEHIIFDRKRHNPYKEAFSRLPNILYIREPVRIADLLRRTGLFFHYGSTCLAESYLLGIPSVFVTSEELYGEGKNPTNPNFYFHDSGWESSVRADIDGVSALVTRHLREPLTFTMRPHMRRVLLDVFNIDDEHLRGAKAYEPSLEIARFLAGLAQDAPQALRGDDPYVLNALDKGGLSLLDAIIASGVAALQAGNHGAALRELNEAHALSRRLDVDLRDLDHLRVICMSHLGMVQQAQRIVDAMEDSAEGKRLSARIAMPPSQGGPS